MKYLKTKNTKYWVYNKAGKYKIKKLDYIAIRYCIQKKSKQNQDIRIIIGMLDYTTKLTHTLTYIYIHTHTHNNDVHNKLIIIAAISLKY